MLNPTIGLLFASAFFLLWTNQRGQGYILMVAASYVVSSLGFVIQDVGPNFEGELERIPSNICFLITGYLLIGGVIKRYGLRIPHATMAGLVIVGAIGQVWFVLMQPDLTARVFLVNFLLGCFSLIGAIWLWGVDKRHFVDRLLFWVTVLCAVNFLLRPASIMLLAGGFTDFGSFQQSFYWTTVQFTQVMISVLFALTLMVAIALDLIAELRREAYTDKLSELLNRRGFEQEAGAALKDCAARRQPACLLIVDLDHFKSINDTWGHAVGDQVISLFGRHVAASLRPGMVAGRIGGEEFAVLIADTELGAARRFAEGLRTDFPGGSAGFLPGPLSPTVSIGLCMAGPGTELYDLLHRADEALYHAKRLGRNQVQVFTPRESAAVAAQPASA
jgi:diguanylate cyclase (GGDEF)-like protein